MIPLNGLDMLLAAVIVAAVIYGDEIIAWIDEHSERRRWR